MKREVIVAIVLSAMALIAADKTTSSRSESFSISKDERHHTLTFTNFEAESEYSVSVGASGGKLVSASAPSGIMVTPTDQSELFSSATATKTAGTLPDSFNFVFSGYFRPDGDAEGGSDLPWDVEVGTKFYYIKSNQENGEKEIIVPAGTSVTYTAYEGANTKSSNWTVNGQSKNDESSIIFNRRWWDVPGWFSASMETPDPAIYNISARATDNSDKSDSGTMIVVGVDRIEGIAEAGVSFWNNLNNDASADYLLCIETGEDLALKAFPKGYSTWPEQQPVWSSSGSWLFSNQITGNQDGVDQVTINTSEDNDNFTVTVSCGMSSKAVMIKTFKYQFRLNVEIASNAEPINIGFSDTFNGFRSVGHAWWKVGLTNNSIEMENIDLASHQNANYIGVDVGYYPLNSTLPPDFSSPGELKVNDSGSADCYREKELTRQEFIDVVNYTYSVQDRPGTYVLCKRIDIIDVSDATQFLLNFIEKWKLIVPGASFTLSNEKNCVTVAKEAASKAGISIGATETNGVFEEAGIKYHFIGNSPLALYNVLTSPSNE